MKRVVMCFLITIFCCTLVNAQKVKYFPELKNFAKADAGVQGIGLSYDAKLSSKKVIEIAIGAGGGYVVGEGSFTYTTDFLSPSFYIAVQPKFYYGRKIKPYSNEFNSGNFFGFRAKYSLSPFEQDYAMSNVVLFNVHWGLQRAIAKKLLISNYYGFGYAADDAFKFGTIYPAVDLKLSYKL